MGIPCVLVLFLAAPLSATGFVVRPDPSGVTRSLRIPTEITKVTIKNHKRSALSMTAIPDPMPVLTMPPAPPALKFKWMPLRRSLRLLKVGFGLVTFVPLFLVNLITSLLFMVLKPWMRKIVLKRFAGFMMTYSMTPLIELKFDIGRMLTYVPHLTKSEAKLFTLRTKMRTADELLGEQRLPSDDVFISQIIQRTPAAFYTENMPDKLVTNMTKLDDLVNYPETFYDVNLIEIDKENKEITIHTKSSGPISRRTHGDVVFERAMQHAMVCICYFLPGIGHSWVHFLFPDAVAAVVQNEVPRDSVLYKLLEPHIRYTSRINWEALGVRGPLSIGGSSFVSLAAEASTTAPRGVPPSPLVKKFEPWTPFAMSANEFIRKNSERTTEYYLYSDEFECPPKWFTGPNAELPYIKSIKRYYKVIRDHVEEVLKFEDPHTIEGFIAAVDKASSIDEVGLDLMRFDPIDVVASLIFDAAIVHSTDHYFTYKVFSEARYGIGTLRSPFVRSWFPGKRVPADIIDEEDRIRWYNFAEVFVKFNDNPIWNNSMKTLRYGFRQKELRNAGKDLMNEIAALQDQMKKDSDIFCPMEQLSRSICF